MIKRLNPSDKLRILHVFNHSMIIFALLYGDAWMWLISLCVWYIISSLGISIGFHRYLSHKSFSTHEWFKRLCTFLGCLASGGSPITWAGAHRLHHAFADKKKDPHSIKNIGFLRTYFHLWKPVHIPRRFIRDLIKDPWLRGLHRHYFLILTIWAFILYSIHPLAGIFLYSIPSVLALHAFGHINALSHTFGYQTFPTKDTSTNNWFSNILTCGEGWHNNHHYFPRSYRIGLKRWELDLGAWILESFPLMTSHHKMANDARLAIKNIEKKP